MLRIIAAKMPAISALLANATDAIRTHNKFHFQKELSVFLALLLGMFADGLQLFFPTKSRISEVPFELHQVGAEAFHDLIQLMRPTGDKSLR